MSKHSTPFSCCGCGVDLHEPAEKFYDDNRPHCRECHARHEATVARLASYGRGEPMIRYIAGMPIVDLPDGSQLHCWPCDTPEAAVKRIDPLAVGDCMIYRLTLEPVARVERNTRIVPVEKVPA